MGSPQVSYRSGGINLQSHQDIEIRQDTAIQKLIAQALLASPRSLPSLLLWDSVGLRLYDKITTSPDYYLTRAEAGIIRANVGEIVQAIGADGIILELGSGSLAKTSIILGELARQEIHVAYYALDMCESSLAESLQNLRSHLNDSPYVSCHPLCMTYEGGTSWLAKQKFRPGTKITVLWLGSSLANESKDVFQKLVNSFTAAFEGNLSLADIQFLVGIDGTKNASLVSRAYDTRDGLSRQFALNIVKNVNRAFGKDVLDPTKWAFDGSWNLRGDAYQTGIRSTQRQEIVLGHRRLEIAGGEMIQLILSRKLSSKEVEIWLRGTSLRIEATWPGMQPESDYGLYKLVLSSSA